jgi:serine/threonine-protein kinase
MRRPPSTAALLPVLLLLLFAAAPAFAGYGAIAWDKETGKRGWSWNQATQQQADKTALSECGASGCTVIIRVGPGRCGALATTADGKQAGGAARKSRDQARFTALKGCPKKSGECVIRVSECNK